MLKNIIFEILCLVVLNVWVLFHDEPFSIYLAIIKKDLVVVFGIVTSMRTLQESSSSGRKEV